MILPSQKRGGEQGIIPLLCAHLQSAGFIVKYESYYFNTPLNLRPDLRIWLPVSQKFIFLEVKMTGWGDIGDKYYWTDSKHDMKKLDNLTGNDLPNGFIAIGFSNPKEKPRQLEKRFMKLSTEIVNEFNNYENIGLRTMDLFDMDKHTSYAVIGLWFRKQ
jgi:hypothetical protein